MFSKEESKIYATLYQYYFPVTFDKMRVEAIGRYGISYGAKTS